MNKFCVGILHLKFLNVLNDLCRWGPGPNRGLVAIIGNGGAEHMARASKINHHPLMSTGASLFGPADSSSDSNGQDSLLPLDDKKKTKKKRIDLFLSWKCVSGGGWGGV